MKTEQHQLHLEADGQTVILCCACGFHQDMGMEPTIRQAIDVQTRHKLESWKKEVGGS